MDVTAVCVPDDGWWVVSVPEVDGAHTQAETLDDVPVMVADAVSLLLEIDPATVRVTVKADPLPADEFAQRLAQ